MSSKPRAFATYLSNQAYLDGCLVLAYSLRKVGSKYPLVVMYPSHLDQQVLDALQTASNITVQLVDTEPWQFHVKNEPEEQHQELTPPGSPPTTTTAKASTASSAYLWAHYSDTWSKLAVWGLVDYERVVLMDSDMLVRSNIDMLLDTPDSLTTVAAEKVSRSALGHSGTTLDLLPGWIAASHACTCNPLRIKAYPAAWTPESCAYTQYTGNPCPPAYDDNDFNGEAASANQPKTESETLPSPEFAQPQSLLPAQPQQPRRAYFNSGLVVLTPSLQQYSKILSHFQTVQDLSQYRFPDQDLLNEVFDGHWKPLGYGFNALKTLKYAHSPVWNEDEIEESGKSTKMQVMNIHYILEKPWDVKDLDGAEAAGNKFVEGYRWWWNAYHELQQELKA